MQMRPVTQKTPPIPSTLISFSPEEHGAYALTNGLEERIASAVASRIGFSIVGGGGEVEVEWGGSEAESLV